MSQIIQIDGATGTVYGLDKLGNLYILVQGGSSHWKLVTASPRPQEESL